MRSSSFRSGQERILVLIVIWVVVVIVGVGMVLFGYALGRRRSADTQSPTEAPVAGLSPTPAAVSSPAAPVIPTVTPLPSATPMATPIPATDTPALPMIEAGPDGLNIRSGPGTNFTKLAHVDPGTQLRVIGSYADWWQVDYNGTPAWAYGGVVTAYNTEGVSQVQPPPSPTPAPIPPTATPTPVPEAPTPVPQPTAPSTRGIVVAKFEVHNSGKKKYAPGPFKTGHEVWFDWDFTNTSGSTLRYTRLGAWIPETGKHTKSWTNEELEGGQRHKWQDNTTFDKAGNYTMYLRICFTDGECVNLAGPVPFVIE